MWSGRESKGEVSQKRTTCFSTEEAASKNYQQLPDWAQHFDCQGYSGLDVLKALAFKGPAKFVGI